MGHDTDSLIRSSLQQAINEVTLAEGSQYQARESGGLVLLLSSCVHVPQPLNYEFFGGESKKLFPLI